MLHRTPGDAGRACSLARNTRKSSSGVLWGTGCCGMITGCWCWDDNKQRETPTVLRAALVNRCFSAEGLSQVGSTGRGASAAAAMHKPPRAGLAGLLHGCSRLCCCHGAGGLLLLHGVESAPLGLRCALLLLQHTGWTGATQLHPTCDLIHAKGLVKCWVACLRAGGI